MNIAELLADKMQSVLGEQYLVLPYHHYQSNYTMGARTPYGEVYDINYQAFKRHGDIIPSTVQVIEPNPVSLPYVLKSCMYTATFWTPLNMIKKDSNGQVIEIPKFDFFADIDRLKAAIENTEIESGDNRCFVTIGEPQLISPATENSGVSKRLVYQIQGQINVADKKLGVGKDIKLSLEVDGQESYLNDIYNVSISSTSDANAVQQASKSMTYNDAAIIGQQIVFTVDDYESTNAALKLVEDKALRNIEILTPSASLENKRKVFVRLYKKSILVNSFWALMSAQYSAGGKTDYASYQVGLVNAGAL